MFRCRLIGGPFDGDEGTIPELPPEIWAYACPADPSRCSLGGVHWGYVRQEGSVRYRQGERPEGGSAIPYLYGDATEPSGLLATRELEPAPA